MSLSFSFSFIPTICSKCSARLTACQRKRAHNWFRPIISAWGTQHRPFLPLSLVIACHCNYLLQSSTPTLFSVESAASTNIRNFVRIRRASPWRAMPASYRRWWTRTTPSRMISLADMLADCWITSMAGPLLSRFSWALFSTINVSCSTKVVFKYRLTLYRQVHSAERNNSWFSAQIALCRRIPTIYRSDV